MVVNYVRKKTGVRKLSGVDRGDACNSAVLYAYASSPSRSSHVPSVFLLFAERIRQVSMRGCVRVRAACARVYACVYACMPRNGNTIANTSLPHAPGRGRESVASYRRGNYSSSRTNEKRDLQ